MRQADTSFRHLLAKSAGSSATGRGNRKRDTTPELSLRRALWKRGLRYRLHVPDLPGRPDIVFRRSRVVVFCDGDFWHGKDWRSRRRRLKRGHNARYWVNKIRRNIQRDRNVSAALEAQGWHVLRFWEADILSDPDAVAKLVQDTLKSRDRLD